MQYFLGQITSILPEECLNSTEETDRMDDFCSGKEMSNF